jgi:ankyrin repeat protein
LIESAMDKNPKGLSDWTPLHVAASEGHLEVCELISDNVTDQSPVTNEGETPLYHAALENHLDICKFLMSKAKLYIASTINTWLMLWHMKCSSAL